MSEQQTNLPKIEGAKDASLDDEKKAEMEVVMDQVIHMDLPTTEAVEVNAVQPDFEGMPAHVEVIEEQKEANDLKIGQQVNANIKRARQARKKTKEKDSLEGMAGVQGAPTPDLWKEYMNEIKNFHKEYLDALKDQQLHRPEVAPLQEEHIVLPSIKTVEMVDPVRPDDVLHKIEDSVPSTLPVSEAPVPAQQLPQKRPSPFEKEEMSYKDRFSKSFKAAFDMNTQAVQSRARADPAMGWRPSAGKTSEVYF